MTILWDERQLHKVICRSQTLHAFAETATSMLVTLDKTKMMQQQIKQQKNKTYQKINNKEIKDRQSRSYHQAGENLSELAPNHWKNSKINFVVNQTVTIICA